MAKQRTTPHSNLAKIFQLLDGKLGIWGLNKHVTNMSGRR